MDGVETLTAETYGIRTDGIHIAVTDYEALQKTIGAHHPS
jgi:hypothetical protein